MKLSVALKIAAAVALVAVAIAAFPGAEPTQQLTINDRSVWGIDESGNLVTPPPATIHMILK